MQVCLACQKTRTLNESALCSYCDIRHRHLKRRFGRDVSPFTLLAMPEDSVFYTIPNLAKALGIAERTINHACSSQGIPLTKRRGGLFTPHQEVKQDDVPRLIDALRPYLGDPLKRTIPENVVRVGNALYHHSELLTTREAAAYVGISPETFIELAERCRYNCTIVKALRHWRSQDAEELVTDILGGDLQVSETVKQSVVARERHREKTGK